MSVLPSQHTYPGYLRLGLVFVLGAFVVSCAARPRENGKAADSLTATTEPVAAPSVPTAPLAPMPETSLNEQPTTPRPDQGVAQESAAKAERKRETPAKPAAVSGASGGSPKRAKAASRAPSQSTLDETENAQPAYAEPPELHRALAEFDAQWEALSTSRACDDACRALESMRRSAQKICDLVLDGDPRARCPTARARLERAERDLSARCTTCK